MRHYTTKLIAGRDFGMACEPNLESCPAHTHSYIEIAYTVSGEAVHILNGEKTILRSGDYVIINPGDVHGYEVAGPEPYAVINCIFNAKFVYPAAKINSFKECLKSPVLNVNTEHFSHLPSSHIFQNTDESLCTIFELLMQEYNNKEYKYRTICRNLLNTVLLRSARELSHISQSTFLLSEYMKDYISMHYEEENLLHKMSNEINYSVPYMSSKFKRETGITFKTFLQNTRIDAAIALLHETKMSINEIASAVGYKDIKHFYTTFKKITNSTPSQHRP